MEETSLLLIVMPFIVPASPRAQDAPKAATASEKLEEGNVSG